jgi:hypothetical protein
VRPDRISLWLTALRLGLAVAKALLKRADRSSRCEAHRSALERLLVEVLVGMTEVAGAAPAERYGGRGRSGSSLSLSTMRQSSASDAILIFRMKLLRWTFTVDSAMPISAAICLLSRP